MKSKPKIKIKNFPRFILFSTLSLIIVFSVLSGMVTLTSKLVVAFNSQREILQTASVTNSSEANAPKTETATVNNTTTQNAKTDTTPSVKDTNPQADI